MKVTFTRVVSLILSYSIHCTVLIHIHPAVIILCLKQRDTGINEISVTGTKLSLTRSIKVSDKGMFTCSQN